MTRRPPRSPLFPYTTLSRSSGRGDLLAHEHVHAVMFHPPARHGIERRRLERLAGRQTEAGVMPRTADRVADDESLGERSEEHTSELQSQSNLVCRLLLEKKK